MNLNGKKWKGRKRMIAIKEKNVITIEFEGHDTLESPMLYQYDKGQKIKFLDVPDGAEVQFSNWATEMTKNKIVVNGQVEIPDILLQENKKILAYLKIINSDSETTIKTVIIPVKARTKPADYIEPEQEKPFRKYVEEKLENAEKLVAEANDKVKVNEECLKQIDIKTEQSVNQIAEVTKGKIKDLDNTTTAKIGDINALVEAKNKDIDSLVIAKMGDLTNTTNAKLEDINNTAQAQIDAINGAGRANIESVNDSARQNINNLNNAYTENLEKFNNNADNVYNDKAVALNEVTSSKLTDINNTATSQIRAINNTALTQINAINKTSQSQVQNMTVKYSDMCRTLGIEHEGILCLRNLRQVSINVASFKYIKFGKMYIDSTDKKLISNQGPYLFNVDNFGYINTDEEYDISSEKEVSCHSEYYHNPELTVYVDYKLYNKSEETTEE